MVNLKELLNQNPLFVFALESEAADFFQSENTLFTGVGKINAAYRLTKQILENKPSIIINLGSAGSNQFHKGTVVCCTQFVQRDMDTTQLGSKPYETPFSGIPPILTYGYSVEGLSVGICGTGDSFEMRHSTDDYNVVEMEAYPLAYIAMQEQIPFLCLKYISDGADDAAADSWEEMVHRAGEALREAINSIR